MKGLQENSKLLVISKETDDIPCLAHCLENGGYSCTFVNNQNEADRLLKELEFDAIVYSGEQYVVIRPIQRFLFAS